MAAGFIASTAESIDSCSSESSEGEWTSITETYRRMATGGGGGDSSVEKESELQIMARTETRKLVITRNLVFALLLLTGAAVCTTTYIYLSNEVQEDNEERFALMVDNIDGFSRAKVMNIFDANRALSRAVTANVLQSNQTFPFCTIDTFELYAMDARMRGNMDYVTLNLHVEESQRQAWESYSALNMGWIQTSRHIVVTMDKNVSIGTYDQGNFTPFLYRSSSNGEEERDPGPGPYAATWHSSPAHSSWINFNRFSVPGLASAFEASVELRDFIFGPTNLDDLENSDPGLNDFYRRLDQNEAIAINNLTSSPTISTIQPVFDTLDPDSSNIVGWLWGTTSMDHFLPASGVEDVDVVVQTACGEAYTFHLDEGEVEFVGVGDLHHPPNDSSLRVIQFYDNYQNAANAMTTKGHCDFSLYIYPDASFEHEYNAGFPAMFTACIGAAYVIVIISFLVFDMFVRRRHQKIMGEATKTNAIVSSLFPSTVRDRLFGPDVTKNTDLFSSLQTKSNLRTFLAGGIIDDEVVGEGDDFIFKTKPIADLFTDTTIMFADISGFTAWSSVREPAQVFTLLETVYHSFDEIARKRRVFKVETVGDCYVAVCGLPDPRKDHAVAMARFARDCMHKMQTLTRKLELSLGPDTGELTMRMGLHSGSVTAGVLRGERSRFQLFGDTMNTAARMEHTGVGGRIQVTQETADLLIAAGKAAWLKPRQDKVVAKGKGEMQTHWLAVIGEESDTVSITNRSDEPPEGINSLEGRSKSSLISRVEANVKRLGSDKEKRLIEWNVDIMLRLLKQVVARRQARGNRVNSSIASRPSDSSLENLGGDQTVLDEVKEIVTLPKFDAKLARNQAKVDDSIHLPDQVIEQLRSYVFNISAMYRDNPFHNFEHASHVTMSVVKLMSRIVAPSDLKYDDSGHIGAENLASTLHDHTYGITSDPLTQFACVFSALIHDCDHAGVPNAQLVKENHKLAAFYRNKSIAEQNSVDLAWSLLMDSRYDALRSTICATEFEKRHFRQLVVNAVMATDIVDKELKALRNARWEKAFSENFKDRNADDAINRKATIVIEHLIQASDVAHTMQHWHIYRKWNERFFEECYAAYLEGRADSDPSEQWYQGEIGFFDFYIIPLAKKLKECGVFGVSSDEYLTYAKKNRDEWETRGKEVVAEMVKGIKSNRRKKVVPVVEMLKTAQQSAIPVEIISKNRSHGVDFSSQPLEHKLEAWKKDVDLAERRNIELNESLA